MFEIAAIPAFRDNYIWLIRRTDRTDAYIVDPGDADAVRRHLNAQGLTLRGVLVTHHHPDHTAGIPDLVREQKIPVLGPARERVPYCTRRLEDGETVTLPELDLALDILWTPGHTKGHIAFHSAAHGLLFCGDTLFSVGCGRLFEGTAAQMQQSLSRLRALPDETRIYCAHEYTLSNLKFALAVEPVNEDLQQRLLAVKKMRDGGQPSLPSQIGQERLTNPFLRWDHPDVVRAAEQHAGRELKDDVTVFATLRHWKDHF
ncbi:MAG: hydroxyacylglutathione hydrolase [Pseudomonadota bacterium]|nr:hydroxyacylglutathione hydrolase [Pseudomonadota bacterium]